MNTLLIIIGGALTFLWGVSHLFPTANVVRDFGNISQDNKRIITMEWINEGATLIFLGTLVISLVVIDATGPTAVLVYWMVAGMLVVLAIISLFTGFRVKFLPFRLCPIIFSGSAILIVLGII
jgi:predicted RND superfamily exporter protein